MSVAGTNAGRLLSHWEKVEQKVCESQHLREGWTFRTDFVGGLEGIPQKQSIHSVHSKEVGVCSGLMMCLQPRFPQYLKTEFHIPEDRKCLRECKREGGRFPCVQEKGDLWGDTRGGRKRGWREKRRGMRG